MIKYVIVDKLYSLIAPVKPVITRKYQWFSDGLDVTKMGTLKSGWTPYVYSTTLCSSKRTIYANFFGYIFEKSGEIKVRDDCARKRVEDRF